MSKQPYQSVEVLLNQIDGANGEACRRIYADYKELFETAPGALHNHQTWPGGYIDHVVDAMNIAAVLFDSLNSLRPLPFTKSDALLVVFLHDLEKPFKYKYDKSSNILTNPEMTSEAAKLAKRLEIIKTYGIQLDEQQANAFKYIEGVKSDEYTPNQRTMGELASLCHCSDTLSARLWYNHPLKKGDDPWDGSARVTAHSADITLESELGQNINKS